MHEIGGNTYLFTWQGDVLNNTLVLMLGNHGLMATNEGVYICIHSSTQRVALSIIEKIVSERKPDSEQLLSNVKNLEFEKWDWALPLSVLNKSFASAALEIELSIDFLNKVLKIYSKN